MNATSNPARTAGPRSKPRLVLMGEFSAGKSTLSNLLLGGAPLPVQVTATRLPPVHITQGPPAAFAEDRNGERHPIADGELGHVRLEDTVAVHLQMESELLELCDLVDMPGISDPNMPADIWDGVASPRDIVIWCTHATQAWRQSEAATWDRMRPFTSGRNLLVINQYDKLRTPRDRQRVLARVKAETADKFLAIYPASLLEALRAGDDAEAWKDSGAAAFMDQLVDLLVQSGRPAAAPAQAAAPGALPAKEDRSQTARIITLRLEDPINADRAAVPAQAAPPPVDAGAEVRVLPRRVQANPGPREREHAPRRPSSDPGLQP